MTYCVAADDRPVALCGGDDVLVGLAGLIVRIA